MLLSLGHLHAIHGRHQAALDCWRAALAIFERLGEDTGRAMSLCALALYRFDRDAFRQRQRQAEEALAILDQGGSPHARACVLHCLGILYHNHGRAEPARRCFEEALELRRAVGSRRGEAELQYRLGVVLAKQGRDEQAASMLRQALTVMRHHGDRLNASCVEVHLGTALVRLGRHDQARPLLERWGHSDHPYLRGVALRGLGELSQAHGRHEDARTAFAEALRLFTELDIPAEEALAMQALTALDEDRRDAIPTGRAGR